ncbi:hypothetical protein OROGR_030218 [Orobanche gracilis]
MARTKKRTPPSPPREEEGDPGENTEEGPGMEKKKAKEHIGTLKKLQEKDPEFYEFLKEHDKELLEFSEEDLDENFQTDAEEEEETDIDKVEHIDGEAEKAAEPLRNVITNDVVDSWCDAIRNGAKLGAVRSLLRAFRSACHYGDDDDGGDDPTTKFSTMSSSVFNKIMLFVLTEMDGIFRGLLRLPPSGGKKGDDCGSDDEKTMEELQSFGEVISWKCAACSESNDR